jgi:hypothetical protein
MVNFHCQVDWIEKHLGSERSGPLCGSVMVFPETIRSRGL